MKILWITNILFPEAAGLISNKVDLRASGGWMLGAVEALLKSDASCSIAVATVSRLVNKLSR